MKKTFALVSVFLLVFSGCALFRNSLKSGTENDESQRRETSLSGEKVGDINDKFDEFHKFDYVELEKLNKSENGISIPIESYSVEIKDLFMPNNDNAPNNVFRNQTYLYFTVYVQGKYLTDLIDASAFNQPGLYVFIGKFAFKISAFNDNDKNTIALSFEVKDMHWKEILEDISENSAIFLAKNPLFAKNDQKIIFAAICTNCHNPYGLNVPEGDIKKFDRSKIVDVTNNILEGRISNRKGGGYGLPDAKIVFTEKAKRYEATTDSMGYFKIIGGIKLNEGMKYRYEVFYKNKSISDKEFTKDSIERPYLWLWVDL